MLTQLPRIVFAALFLSVFAAAHAEEPGKVNLEAAEMVAELIGAPVFAGDGAEVGKVADISFDDEGQPNRLRMTTARALGLGSPGHRRAGDDRSLDSLSPGRCGQRRPPLRVGLT